MSIQPEGPDIFKILSLDFFEKYGISNSNACNAYSLCISSSEGVKIDTKFIKQIQF